jgi:hypothetical protein
MTYEYMNGMGTVEEAERLSAQARTAYDSGNYSEAIRLLEQAEREDPATPQNYALRRAQALARANRCDEARRVLDGFRSRFSSDPAFSQYERLVGASCPTTGAPATAAGEPAPTAEKQTWWPTDVGAMFETVATKLGIGGQANQEAQGVAMETAANLTGQVMVPGAGAAAATETLPPPGPSPAAVTAPMPSVGSTIAPYIVGGLLVFGFAGVGIWLLVRKK